MSNKSFDEVSEQVRHLLEVAGGSCDAYSSPPDEKPVLTPKKNYRVWEEEVSSPLLHTTPEPVITRTAPDWIQSGDFSPAGKNSNEPSRDELDEFIRESLGFEKPEMDPIVHQCCGCSCVVCEHGHGKGQHTKECRTRIENEVLAPASASAPVSSDPEEMGSVECGGMVQVYRGETAHPPITKEYQLVGPVDDAGELYTLYSAFQTASLDVVRSGIEDLKVVLDSGTYPITMRSGNFEVMDTVKGLRYVQAGVAETNQYEPIVEENDIFLWVVAMNGGQDYGYIHDGYVYTRQ